MKADDMMPKPEHGTLGYAELGAIMLREAGEDACRSGYDTIELDFVGRLALLYGDINPDGTLN